MNDKSASNVDIPNGWINLYRDLTDISAKLAIPVAKLAAYLSALGAIALVPQSDVPSLLAGIASSIGVNMLSHFLARVAEGDEEGKVEVVGQAIQKSGIDKLLDNSQDVNNQLEKWGVYQEHLRFAVQENQQVLKKQLRDQGLTIKAIREDVRRLLNNTEALLDREKSTGYQFATLIQEYTEEFVGRDFVFDSFNRFVEEHKKGYFLITGDPGIGKTSIIAKYVQRTGALYHFNSYAMGITLASEFIKSISNQIVDKFKLSRSIPSNALDNGGFLIELLDKLKYSNHYNQPLVIAVDALDEVDLSRQSRNSNILYLPPTLPDGIFFLCSSRRDKMLPLPHIDRSLHLMDFPEKNRQDVRRYIEYVIEKRPGLQEVLTKNRLYNVEFIENMLDKSENNFMYLRYILPEIEKGTFSTLAANELPQGLTAYYQVHWRRMGMEDKMLPGTVRTKLKIIYLLSLLKRPCSANLLAALADETLLEVQQVLREWSQFMKVDASRKYSFYHASFRDFLHEDEVVQSSAIDLDQLRKRIAAFLNMHRQKQYGNPNMV